MDEFWNASILPVPFLFFKLSEKKSCARKTPLRFRVPARLRVDFLRARENNALTVPAERAGTRLFSERKTHKLEGSRNMIETTATVRVRFSETDAMGVVYHANYFPWFEIARTKLLAEIGLPYREMQDAGWLLPVVDAQISYRVSAKYDDELSVRAMMKAFPRARIRIDYEVRRGDTLLATGSTVHGFMNRVGAAVRPPNFFLEKLAAAFAR